MRFNAIELHHFLTHRRFGEKIRPDAKVLLLAGPNGAGKSAIIEAIRWALGDKMPRDVTRKADLDALLLEGEKDGHIGLDVTEAGRDQRYTLSLKTGNFAGNSPPRLTAAERAALIPSTFMDADEGTRRRMLFELAGIDIKIDVVAADLAADGHDPDRIRQVTSFLGKGFGAAAKRAAELGTEAKGAWRAITGENWGSKKGEEWRAEVPEAPERHPDVIAEELRQVREELKTLRTVLADTQAAQRAAEGAAEMRQAAGEVAKLTEAVTLSKARIASLEAQLFAQKQAATAAGGWTAPCPCCGVVLESSKAGDLHEYAAPDVAPPQAAAAARDTESLLGNERTLLQRAEKALAHATACQLALASLPEMPAPEAVRDATEDVEAANAEASELETELEAARAAVTGRASAKDRTDRAARHHADALAYATLSDAVDALPARYLDKALAEMNGTLAALTPVFGKPVQIGTDMVPTYGRFPYPQLAESEQWRVQLAIGYALASRTIGVCLVDRLDVVQPSSRPPIIKWMAAQEDVQFIVAATLKEKPTLPPAIQVRWLGETA